MKFLFDLLPVILFFATYKIAGANPDAAHALATQWFGSGIMATQAPILIATAATIVATFLQIAIVWIKHRKVDAMLWVSLAIIVVFGGATLFFTTRLHQVTLPSIGCSVRCCSFPPLYSDGISFARYRGANSVARFRMGAAESRAGGLLPSHGPHQPLRPYSRETWVNFKLFGATGLMLAFVLGQGVYLSRHIEETN